MSCHPTDDRPILEIRERLGETPTTYVAGYLHVDQAFAEIASSSLVIGERLHACVLAAAAGRPFVPIEYRPKVRDFALSVGMGEHVVRTDEVSGLSLVEAADDMGAPSPEMTTAVAEYRNRLTKAAEAIRVAIES
jgi:polysaccharide pyruvyl transferase WcaK-like protein